jgi:NTE family protein
MSIFRPARFGLALGGGGVRGLAHIGVLRALDDEGLRPNLLSGTSMGGLIASLYASGMSSQEMEREAIGLSRPTRLIRLVEFRPPRRGLLRTGGVRTYLEGLLGKDRDFSSLQIPTVLTAVDLETAEEVLLREGVVVDAIMATIAVPSIFEPTSLGGRLLVDGGVLDNVPAGVVRKMGAEVTVAVDVGSGMDLVSADKRSTLRGVAALLPQIAIDLLQVEGIMLAAITAENLRSARPEVVIRPRFPPGVTSFSGFELAQEIIRAGEEATRLVMPRLRRLLSPSPLPALRRAISSWPSSYPAGQEAASSRATQVHQ